MDDKILESENVENKPVELEFVDNEIFEIADIENKLSKLKTLSLVGLILSGAYFVVGLISLIFSFLPIPFPFSLIAIPLYLIFNVVEFGCMVGSFTVNGLALGKLFGMKKKLALNPEDPENGRLAKEMKLAWIFSIVGLSVTCVCCVLYTLLLILEVLLSLII